MTLLDSTLSQLTTAFSTAARLDTRTPFEVPTIQMVYIALVELEERRRGDALPFTALPTPVYVAGPMSGHDDLNWPAFRQVEAAIVVAHSSAELLCGTPHRINLIAFSDGSLKQPALRPSGEAGFAQSLRWMLANAESVVLLPNWRDSHGTVAEVAAANRLKIPTFEVRYRDGEPVGVERVDVRVGVL